MTTYKVTLHNDMGHLMHVNGLHDNVPYKIIKFVYEKTANYIESQIDSNGARSYRMKPGFEKRWTYEYDPTTTVHFEFLG